MRRGRKRRTQGRRQTTQDTNHKCACMDDMDDTHEAILSHKCDVRPLCINGRRAVCSEPPPVGDSRLPSAVTDFHDKNSKFFCTLRLFPQISIEPPKYRFPCVISGHTIFEVSAHNQTPTSLNASATKTRMKRFVPSLLASFCLLLASGAALLTTHF